MIDTSGDVARLDPSTGQVTSIGSTGISGRLWDGMAIDSQGRIYSAYGDWIVGYGIYEIDPQTGQATFVVQTQLGGIGAIAIDSYDVFYAHDHRDAPLIVSPEDLHVVDLITGTTSFIGELGGTGRGKMDFFGGILWAHNVEVGLVQVDENTAVPTDVNPAAPPIPFTFPDAFCSSGEGTLFHLGIHLWVLDPSTGAATRGPVISQYSDWSGAVVLDSQPEPFSLWYGGLTGGPMEIHLSGASPGSSIALAWTIGPGGPTTIPGGFPCSGLSLDLNGGMRPLGTITAGLDGKATIGPFVIPPAASQTLRIQAVDLATCSTSNVATVWY